MQTQTPSSKNTCSIKVIMHRLILLALVLFCVTGCSATKKIFSHDKQEEKEEVLPAAELARYGLEDYNTGKYYKAKESFEKILEAYRFSEESVLAELKIADCNYYMENYEEAVTAYEKFEEMHPTNEAIPYVMYQKAMCYYKKIDRVDRDNSGAINSIKYFNQLLKAYPDSPYTKDAVTKIDVAKEFLAEHEFAVAQYYKRIHEKDQAITRLKYLLTMYPDAEIVPKAKKLLNRLEGDQ